MNKILSRFLVLAALCSVGSLSAQSTEFDWASGCTQPQPINGEAVVFFVTAEVDGAAADINGDFLAVFNGNGDLVGRSAVKTVRSNGVNVPGANIAVRAMAGSNGCPTYLDATELTVKLSDASNGDAVLISTTPAFEATLDGGVIAGPDNDGATGDLFNFLASALPVSLTDFTATPNGSAVKLSWSTSTEVDNDYFEVQRSATPNGNFANIGKVLGNETISSRSDYEFTDNTPVNGTNYYRLQQFDLNGDSEFSPILVVEMETAAERAVRVFPNPADVGSRMTLRLDGEWTNASVKMVDANGREVANWNNLRNGSLNTELPVVKAGVYQLIATDGKEQQITRMVIR